MDRQTTMTRLLLLVLICFPARYAPGGVPSIPARVSPSARLHSHMHGPPRSRPVELLDPADIPGYSQAYSPATLRQAYGFDKLSADGSGQKIGIIVAYGNPRIQQDLAAFCTYYNLPPAQLQVIGQPSRTGVPTDLWQGWSRETTLDVEWAHVIAPRASLLLVVAADPSFGSLMSAVATAVQQGAQVVSMSWGASEAAWLGIYDSVFASAGSTSFVASSGDSGEGVSWPAVSPSVLAVGGTSLEFDSGPRFENAWSGSGGGVSTSWLAPDYQQPWQSTGLRTVPDVAFDADPRTGVWIYNSDATPLTPWIREGGTSFSAPAWAGLLALANSLRRSPLGDPHQALYAIETRGSAFTAFHDIDTGCDVNSSNCASTGYDTVTGLGTPRADVLVPLLSGPRLLPIPDTGVSDATDTASIPFTATEADTAPLSLRVTVADCSGTLYSVSRTYRPVYRPQWDGYLGQGDKWFQTADGGWLYMARNGDLFRGDGTLLAHLCPQAYSDVTLLTAAQDPGPTPTAGVSGGQINLQGLLHCDGEPMNA